MPFNLREVNMAELKCPHCGQAFTVDDTELSSIVKQIRDKEFEKDLNSRLSEIKSHMLKEHELEIAAKDNEHKRELPIRKLRKVCYTWAMKKDIRFLLQHE